MIGHEVPFSRISASEVFPAEMSAMLAMIASKAVIAPA
jgi:hypothetical protein